MAVSAGLLARIGINIDELTKGLKRAERDLKSFSRRAGETGNILSAGISAPLAIIGGSALKAAGDIEQLQLALESTFKNQGRTIAESRKELEALRQSAKAPGLDFEQAVKASIRFQNVGISAEKARKAIEELANATATSGGTAENFNSATVQFSQLLGKGKIEAQDIKIILENIPALAGIFKEKFGGSTAEQIRASGVSAKEFVDITIEGLSKLERVQGGIANSFVNFKTEVKNALGTIGLEINKAFDVKGIVDGFAERISKIAEAFKALSPETKKTIVEIALLVAAIGPIFKIVSLLSTGFSVLLSPVALVTVAIVALAAAFIYAYNNSEKFRASISGAVDAVKKFWEILFNNIKTFKDAIKEAFIDFSPANLVKKIFTSFNPLGAALSAGRDIGEAFNKGFKEKLDKEFAANLAGVKERMSKAFKGVDFFPRIGSRDGTTPFPFRVPEVKKAAGFKAPGAGGGILADLKKELTAIDNLAKAFGSDIAQVVQDKIDAITGAVEKLIQSGVKPASAAIKGLIADIKSLRGETPTAPGLIPTTALPAQVESIDPFANIAGGDPEGLRGQIEALNAAMEASAGILTRSQEKALQLRDAMVALGGGITGALKGAIEDLAAGLGDAIGNIIANVGNGAQIAASIFGALINLLSTLGKIAIQVGTALLAITTSIKTLNPFVAIAAGVGLIALASLLKGTFGKSIPALADGGIVNGPTLALIGERGPEAVVPLSQLDNFGGEAGTLTTRISGDDLYILYQRAQRRKGRIG